MWLSPLEYVFILRPPNRQTCWVAVTVVSGHSERRPYRRHPAADVVSRSRLSKTMLMASIWRVLPTPAALLVATIVASSAPAYPAFDVSQPDYSVYHNLSAVYAEVAALAEAYPTYVQVDHRFKSRNGLSQLLVRLTNFSDSALHAHPQFQPTAKVRALLVFGLRGGELVTVESALHLLRRLLAGVTAPAHTVNGSFSRTVLAKTDLHLVVLANPDGRNHVERSGDYCFEGIASGAKMDSLFAWDLDQRQAAEMETHILRNLSHMQAFDVFVAFRSGVREIHLPFAGMVQQSFLGWSGGKPANLDAMTALAKELAAAMKPRPLYGQARHLFSAPVNGTALDFMAGVRKVPFSLSIGLFDGGSAVLPSDCFRQLNPDSAVLKETLDKLHPLYRTLFLHLIVWKEERARFAFTIENEGPSLLLWAFMLCLVVLVMVLFRCQRRLPDSMRFYPRRRIVSLKTLSSSLHAS